VEPLALYYHPDVLEHDTGQHPERIARLQAIAQVLQRDGLTAEAPFRAAPPASVEQITRVHSVGYVATIERIARGGGGQLDADTLASPGSYRAATRAAGNAVAAAAAVARGEARRAFALGRPPGHHARPGQAMGFCLFNNVAIAARELQAGLGLERVAIVDVDVHHGNGTQESFYEDPTILFVSTHQYPFYPGSGALNEIGTGAGRGTTVNLPLPAGCGDGEYRLALERVIAPALRRFGPDLILVSLGFDAHWADPLAQMRLSIEGYVRTAERLAALADELCAGRLALVLEGGYSLEALGYATLAVARALRGDLWDDPLGAPPGAAPTDGQGIAPILDAARQIHGLDD
jgi:acetoin utilization deacetylase AcuC-like enzyme